MKRRGLSRRQKKRRAFKKAEKKIREQRFHSVSEGGYVRVNVRYPISYVLSLIGHRFFTFFGHKVKMWSKRYSCFQKHGVVCVSCGIRAAYFRLECEASKAFIENYPWHFNLYAVNADGEEVLMTKDHIIPLSKGGKNSLVNLQTMCWKCNGEKGNSMEEKK